VSRIDACFERLLARNRRALIPFVTAGDPDPGTTVALMHAMVAAGADIVELGIAFSDPVADGPVIQRASERALAAGISLHRAIDLVAEFRTDDQDTPVVFMGYLNPFEVMGYAEFARAASTAGVDGVLTVDLPPEEADAFVQAVRGHAMDPIFLLAPTSDERRIDKICRYASGYIYYVSLKGVTGAATLDVDGVARKLESIKAVTRIPVGVGFGIRDARTAADVAEVSDAVVVGTALVERIEALQSTPEKIPAALGALVAEMRQAMDDRTAL